MQAACGPIRYNCGCSTGYVPEKEDSVTDFEASMDELVSPPSRDYVASVLIASDTVPLR